MHHSFTHRSNPIKGAGLVHAAMIVISAWLPYLFGKALTQDTKLQMLFPPLTKQSHCFTSQFSTRRDQTKSYRFFWHFYFGFATPYLFPAIHHNAVGQKPWVHSFFGTGFYAFKPCTVFWESLYSKISNLESFYFLLANLLVSSYDLKRI